MPRARFPGRCGICEGLILEGDDIEQVDGEWCHAACAADEGYLEDDDA